MAFERQGVNAWPSDVTLLEHLRSLGHATKWTLATWVTSRITDAASRTVLANTASALQRLENDGLIYRTRDDDDARIFVYRVTK